MRVTVNGGERALDDGSTVADVVRVVTGADRRAGVAVALNGEVVARARWDDRVVDDGDRIEVLNAVQGG